MIKISVIIQVYNTEKYLGDCLNSVFCQWLEEIEVIIIDDGSNDNSSRIYEAYKIRYPDINLIIIRQKNAGLSVARNVGIECARGEYILFLDSDDMLFEKAFTVLLNLIKKYSGIDVYLYDADILDELEKNYNIDMYHRDNCVIHKVMDGKTYITQWYMEKVIVSACLCLFRRDYIMSNNYKFTAGKLHEDFSFSFKTVLNATNVLYVPQRLYIRRYRKDSITTNAITRNNYDGIITAYYECINEYDFVEKKDDAFRNSMARYWVYGMEYLGELCKESEGDWSWLEKLLYEMLFRLFGTNKELSYSELYAALAILDFMKKHNMNYDIINEKVNCNYNYSNLFADLKERLNSKLYNIIDIIPFEEKSLKIGIYGIGNHTRDLIKYVKKFKMINADIFFVDSLIKESKRFLDYNVINLENIPSDTDYVIVSSYIHHNELVLNLYKNYPIRNFRIIDFYNTEKMPLRFE